MSMVRDLVSELEAVQACHSELRAAAAALLGIEAYARRVITLLAENTDALDDPSPALATTLDALKTIESYCRSARAEITTADPPGAR